MVDASTQQVNVQPTYYFMGQISKFVVPGSIRVHVMNFLDSSSVTPIDGKNSNGQNVQLAYCGKNISPQRWSYNNSQIVIGGSNMCMDDMGWSKNGSANVQIW